MKRLILSILAFSIAVLVGFIILRYKPSGSASLCEVCARPVHAGMSYRVEVGKKSEIACCPRCGMHYELTHPGAAKRAFARDFYSGGEIPAEKAFYVEGGNQEYCAHVKPVERREMQSTAELTYDRCTPPLVAFASAEQADKYRAEHGGRVLDYSDARESVRVR